MGKFNTKAEAFKRESNTRNLAGGNAFKVTDAKKQLADVILASMMNGDNYYQSDEDRINSIFKLVRNIEDKEFAAKAMVYARQVANLRSVSHVLANAIAEAGNRDFSLRRAVKAALVRPDDMIEMFALWKSRHSSSIPNAMRRAFKESLEAGKWDAYQLKKYARPGQSVKLRDIVLISHPKDKSGVLGKLIDGTLKAPATVENMLASGKKASETFEVLLAENRLGYMVALKNIRNALETGLSNEALDAWCSLISNRNRVMKSRVLPFRFVDAWNQVKNLNIDYFKLQKVKDAINQALRHSAMNLDLVAPGEKVALILDESGSMNGKPWDHAIVLAAVLYTGLPKGSAVVYKFSSGVTRVDFGSREPLDIIENTRHNGGATYFDAPLREMRRTSTKVDKVVMFTDMQLYNRYGWTDPKDFESEWGMYKRDVNRNAQILFWDLAGYDAGTPLELRNGIVLASGFSDKLLELIPKLFRNQNALIDEIEAIRF